MVAIKVAAAMIYAGAAAGFCEALFEQRACGFGLNALPSVTDRCHAGTV
jgi:hypothetical protein